MVDSNSLSRRNAPGQVSGASSRRYSPLNVSTSGGPSGSSSSARNSTGLATRPASVSPGSSSLSDPVVGPGQAPRRRRNRAVLSCLKCHQRRVKCDRKQPCTACIRYGAPEDCKVPDNPKAHEERKRLTAAEGDDSSDGNDDTDCCVTSDDSTGHQNLTSASLLEPSSIHVPYTYGNSPYVIPAPFPVAQSAAPDAYPRSIPPVGGVHDAHSYIAPSQFPAHLHSFSHEGHLMGATSGSNSPLEEYGSHSQFSSAYYGLVPPPTAPSGGGWSGSFATSRSDLDLQPRPYTANRTGDVISRFITEYENQVQAHPAAPRRYSPAEVEDIHSFCEALPTRNLDTMVRFYLDDIEWIHHAVDPDAIRYRFMPDLVHRLFDPKSQGRVNLHEWASHLRFGDMGRLCLLGAMVLCAIQGTGENMLKHTLGQTASAAVPSTAHSENSANSSFSTGPTHRHQYGYGEIAQTSVKNDILTVLEAQARHLIQLSATVEGPSTDLIKARIIFLHFIKNEARMAQSGSFEMLLETAEMTMRLHLHKDPEYLMISNDEKEDRRRLFYNVYCQDRSTAMYFGKKPCIPEDEVETNFPQEHLTFEGKEQLHTFMYMRAKLARCLTRIGTASLEVPVDGEAISNVEMQLQELVQLTQGTPFHPSLGPIPPELSKFHNLDRQRHLHMICFHSAREALHRLAFFEGARLSPEQVAYSREACAQSAIALIETQRSLRSRISSAADLCCFYIPLFTLEPAVTLIISAIVTLQQNPNQERLAKKAKVDCYLEWAQHALNLLQSMSEQVADKASYLLSRVLRKAVAIVDHHLNPGAANSEDGRGAGGVSAHERAIAAAISLERTSAWMQELFCDEHGRRMEMPYMTPPPRPSPFTRAAPPSAPMSTTASEPFLDYHPYHHSEQHYQDASSPASANMYTGSGGGGGTGMVHADSTHRAMAPATSSAGGSAIESIKLATQGMHLDPTLAPPSEQQHLPSGMPGMQFTTSLAAPSAAASAATAAALARPTASSGFVTAPPSVTSQDTAAASAAIVPYNLAPSGLELQQPGHSHHHRFPAPAPAPAPAAAAAAATDPAAPRFGLGVEAGPSLSDLGLGFLDTFLDSSRHQFGSLNNNNNVNHINTNHNHNAAIGATSAGLGQLSLASTSTTNSAAANAAAAAAAATAAPNADLVGPGQAGLEAYMNQYLAAISGAPSHLN